MVLAGKWVINLNTFALFLAKFEIVGSETFDAMMTSSQKIIDLVGKGSEKTRGALGAIRRPQGGGGISFPIKWLLKKLAAPAFGGMFRVGWYLFGQKHQDTIFNLINNQVVPTYDHTSKILGLYTFDDKKTYKLKLEQDGMSFPVYINLRAYIDFFLPSIVQIAYNIKFIKELLAAKNITTEEAFLQMLYDEFNKKTEQGGGAFMGKLKKIPGDISSKVRSFSEKAKGFVGDKMGKANETVKDLYFAMFFFFLFSLIFYIYEHAVGNEGRWVRIAVHEGKLGLVISKDSVQTNLDMNTDFVPLTKTLSTNLQDLINEHEEEAKNEDKTLAEAAEVSVRKTEAEAAAAEATAEAVAAEAAAQAEAAGAAAAAGAATAAGAAASITPVPQVTQGPAQATQAAAQAAAEAAAEAADKKSAEEAAQFFKGLGDKNIEEQAGKSAEKAMETLLKQDICNKECENKHRKARTFKTTKIQKCKEENCRNLR
jgi:hypothetical protein